MAARNQVIREDILAFAAGLSEQTGLPVTLNVEEGFLFYVDQGAPFSSGDANFHIIPSGNA